MSLRGVKRRSNLHGIAAQPSVARNDKSVRIFVSGSIARDLIMDFPGRFRDFIDVKKIHVLNLSFAVEHLQENIGGTAANIAYNLALLGERPMMIGNLGQDQTGLLTYFRQAGINISGVTISRKRTAAAYIITDQDDNQITGFHAGAMNDLRKKMPNAKRSDWAIVAAEHPKNMVVLAKHYQKKGVNYIFDPGQQITALKDSELRLAIRGAKVLIGNDYEIGLINKRLTPSSPPPSFSPFGRSLRQEGEKINKNFSPMIRGRLRGGRPIIIRTLGPKGSELFSNGRKIKIGIAKPKRVLDPTGAGDAYRAGFLKGLILGYDIRTCGQLAASVASFAVEQYGTQRHKFNWKSIAGRYNRNFTPSLFSPS